MEKGIKSKSPIGIFDSGYGGLTIYEKIKHLLPEYDYIYLGDNARAPYGTRSFETVYNFTLEAVKYLFSRGCPLIILACNTASAKALRTIQQNDLPKIDSQKRVLGVIRPTVEVLNEKTNSGHIGVLATPGTIKSGSYDIEIHKQNPEFTVVGQECPMWASLIENNEINNPGTDYFIQRDLNSLLEKDSLIDTVILGCTHYPIISHKIREHLPANVLLLEQGDIVAQSLQDYLKRHPEMEERLSKNSEVEFLTTEDAKKFDRSASLFLNEKIKSKQIILN